MNKKPLGILACIVSVSALLLGCGGRQKSVELLPTVPLEAVSTETISSETISSETISSETISSETISHQEERTKQERLLVRVETDAQSVIFQLNHSTAAESLFGQLPLTLPVENYSNNEKIFYPPEELDVSDTPMAEGPAGTLAYYAPWGDVAMFYGECGGASGLFELGKAVSGIDKIEALNGEIRIEAVTYGDSAPAAEAALPPEGPSQLETSSLRKEEPLRAFQGS